MALTLQASHDSETPIDETEMSDQQLLRDFVEQNNQSAFAALVQMHGPMVYRVCRRVLGNHHDAEEAFQAAFLVLARKAKSIRQQELLTRWLYRVAYRTALRARKLNVKTRTKEQQMAQLPEPTVVADEVWPELEFVVDQELNRLPDKYRMPVLLCDLEGKTGKEAAELLGCSPGTLSDRLLKARKLLSQRLTRRGFALSAGSLAVLFSKEAVSASLSESLSASLSKAASAFGMKQTVAAGVVSAKAIVLANGVLRSMLLTKAVAVAGALLVGTALIAGLAVLNDKGERATAVKLDEQFIRVSGQVFDSNNKPLEGAEITLWWHFGYVGFYKDWRPPVINLPKPYFGAKSEADGRFSFSVAISQIDENPMNIWGWPGRHMLIVAAANGFGPAWASLERRETDELKLTLVQDDVPIQGRVLDSEKRPVAGADVSVERVTIGSDEHRSLWQTTWAGLPENLKTDADGRFTLVGIGRDRTALLHIDAPTIEHKLITVKTPAVGEPNLSSPVQVEVVATPTKPIEGTIRAMDTDKPLEGVVVCGEEEQYHRRVRATTDVNGRYRLVGLPKAETYALTINPPRELGYLPTIGAVADADSLKPIKKNFILRRGVPVRCRFIDQATREPVWGGELHYFPLKSNPHYGDVDEGVIPCREYRPFYAPDSEGYYHFVAWPGIGMLGIMPQTIQGKYLPTSFTSSDSEQAQGDWQLSTWNLMRGCRLIEPGENDAKLDLEIELMPVPPANEQSK